jgi:hypothetical protein
VFSQDGLDFSKLQAKTSHFDLIVVPSNKLDDPIGTIPAHVSGTEQSPTRLRRKGVGNEPVSRPDGLLQISSRQSVTADVQFPFHSDGNGIHLLIQQVNRCVTNRTSDRYAALPGLACRGNSVATRKGGTFGWAITVDEGQPGITRQPSPHMGD